MTASQNATLSNFYPEVLVNGGEPSHTSATGRYRRLCAHVTFHFWMRQYVKATVAQLSITIAATPRALEYRQSAHCRDSLVPSP
ncbi:MAG: hypothetical protein CM15mP84_01200 [Cellvibrionales bacterium]|nr:MAG: hypothetical protein CM15mP84_01200 [Cellvibrionales bacterium]